MPCRECGIRTTFTASRTAGAGRWGSLMVSRGSSSDTLDPHTTRPPIVLPHLPSISMSASTHTPRVPLDVAEHIIDALSGHVRSLCSCALSCSGWLPRARYHLLTSIRVRSHEDLLSIQKFFVSYPFLLSAVRRLSICPQHHGNTLVAAVPVVFLSRFPNLRGYSILDPESGPLAVPTPVCFHPTTLTGIKSRLHVEELQLQGVSFRRGMELARLLGALTHLRRLECRDVHVVDQSASNIAPLHNRCPLLSELTVRRCARIPSVRY